MGCNVNIDYDKYPKQGPNLGSIVDCCFNYDTSKYLRGKVIRDDYEEPFETIIQLDNGRVIKATECQYHYIINKPKTYWLNIYPNNGAGIRMQAGGMYETRAQADAIAKPHRINCVEVWI